MAAPGEFRLVLDKQGRQGEDRLGDQWHGNAGVDSQGWARKGKVRWVFHGIAGTARRFKTRRGKAWPGLVGQAWLDGTWKGSAGLELELQRRHGELRGDEVRSDAANRGIAGTITMNA